MNDKITCLQTSYLSRTDISSLVDNSNENFTNYLSLQKYFKPLEIFYNKNHKLQYQNAVTQALADGLPKSYVNKNIELEYKLDDNHKIRIIKIHPVKGEQFRPYIAINSADIKCFFDYIKKDIKQSENIETSSDIRFKQMTDEGKKTFKPYKHYTNDDGFIPIGKANGEYGNWIIENKAEIKITNEELSNKTGIDIKVLKSIQDPKNTGALITPDEETKLSAVFLSNLAQLNCASNIIRYSRNIYHGESKYSRMSNNTLAKYSEIDVNRINSFTLGAAIPNEAEWEKLNNILHTGYTYEQLQNLEKNPIKADSLKTEFMDENNQGKTFLLEMIRRENCNPLASNKNR